MIIVALWASIARGAPAPGAEIELVAVGDVLPHRRVKASARVYGWDATFKAVKPWIVGADLAIANLESPIAPDAHRGIYGEVFDAPASLATGLAEAGFDVLSMANNHVWDQGVDGMVETMRRVREAGMLPIGVGPSCARAREVQVWTIHTGEGPVRVGLLAFTDLLNADLRAGEDEPCVHVPGRRCTVDCGPDRDALYFTVDRDAVVRWIRAAREQVDLLVLSVHWGDEYRRSPLPLYRELARYMVGAGVDLVVGHHPHVLQPVEWVEADGRTGLVAFSLGNFVSDMGRSYRPAVDPARRGDTRDGVVLRVRARWTEDGLSLHPSLLPTWTRHVGDPRGERIEVVLQRDLEEPLRSIRADRVRAILRFPPQDAGIGSGRSGTSSHEG